MSERLQKRIKLAEAMGWTAKVDLQPDLHHAAPPRFQKSYYDADGNFRERLPDPWTSLDDCAACDAWIAEHKGASYEPVLVRQTARPGHQFAVTGTPNRWDVHYMVDGEDRDVFFGRTLTEAWAHAIYSVVVGDE